MTTDVDVRVPEVPADRDPSTLRRIGALPPERRLVPLGATALTAPAPVSKVAVHLDPGQLRARNGAGTVYSYGPSRIDSYIGDLAVFGDGLYLPHFHVEFWGLPEGTDVVVSIRLHVGDDGNEVHLSATGNPVTMVVTEAATGGQPVTVHVAATVTNGWCTVILEPGTDQQGFVWYAADMRLL